MSFDKSSDLQLIKSKKIQDLFAFRVSVFNDLRGSIYTTYLKTKFHNYLPNAKKERNAMIHQVEGKDCSSERYNQSRRDMISTRNSNPIKAPLILSITQSIFVDLLNPNFSSN